MGMSNSVRLIAFYLPQFYPIPENDVWWGKGFTEWRSVTQAKPLFKGHYQPHLPADLGFYDLRVPEVREAQAAMAREYGISGFCYYHYWFEGKQLLEHPFQEVLKSGRPDFPFCLCWANHNWTRRWDGEDQEILLEQRYSREDDITHIQSLIPYFNDPSYIKIEGKPLVLIYRVNSLPDPRATAEVWREEAARAGLAGLYLCTVASLPSLYTEPTQFGFDATVDFPPNTEHGARPIKGPWCKFRRLWRRFFWDAHCVHNIIAYPRLASTVMSRPLPDFNIFPGVTPSWDNSPRRKFSANIYIESTPELYGVWLRHAIVQVLDRRQKADERIVFINAWNEWAEGNHLEPDQRWGRRYLKETQKALEAFG